MAFNSSKMLAPFTDTENDKLRAFLKTYPFAVLTQRAFSILKADLERYGNTLSAFHESALMELCGLYSKIILGMKSGRYAYPLATGLGKTQSVVAFCTALHELGIKGSVAVAASKVEALCDLKRKLLEHGIPEQEIGLYHSYRFDPQYSGKEETASLPATPEHEERRFMLVTHNRIKGKRGIKHFNEYQGKPRDLLIWDESLFVSKAVSIAERALRGEIADLAINKENSQEYTSLFEYLHTCTDLIQQELSKQQGGKPAELIPMPPLDEKTLVHYRSLVPDKWGLIKDFLEVSINALRVFQSDEGTGVISYEVAVPPELKNIVILDASYPIRTLEKLDSSIQMQARFADKVKTYNRVSIKQMIVASGRSSMDEDFKKDRKTAREVAALIRDTIPENQAVIIFTFKNRGTNYARIVRQEMDSYGIDSYAQININGQPKDRFVFLTWGNETSISDYAYCENVIFAGVLHRSLIDLAGTALSQTDNLLGTIHNKQVREHRTSEIAHSLYQAISRGSCRVVDNGEAMPMNVYLIHKDLSIRPLLNKVMPGVSWHLWEPKFSGANETQATKAALQILEYLGNLDQTIGKVSNRNLKTALGLTEMPSNTFTRATTLAGELGGEWLKDGHNMVRASALFGQ